MSVNPDAHSSAALSAIRTRDTDQLVDVLAAGADPNHADSRGFTLLMEAVVTGQIAAVEALVRFGANVNASDERGWTALHFAAQDFQSEIAKYLLQSGAAVDARDEFGNTPLWRAVFASRGRPELIELLVAHGADPELANRSGISPAKLAATINNFPVNQIMETARRGST